MPYKQTWFGTIDRMRWIDTPKTGADMSPEGWGASGTLMGGGGYVRHSWGSHKVYEFSWRDSSARRSAQLMKSYRDGTYGRGLLYFHDPLSYDINVLPAQLASPGINVASDTPFRFGTDKPILVSLSSGAELDLPTIAAHWTLPSSSAVATQEVYVPIPEGFQLHLGGFYEGDNAAPQFRVRTATGIEPATYEDIPKMNGSTTRVASAFAVTGQGVYISFRKKNNALPAELAVQALTARLIPIKPDFYDERICVGPWQGGQGHSGCRFDGAPTYIAYTGVNGGQIGYAATLREVGLWE